MSTSTIHPTTVDQQLIHDLIERRTQATRRGDAKAICDDYTPDAVVYSLAPPLVQVPDPANAVADLQAWFDGKGGSVWSEVRDLQVTVDGDVAFCTSVESMGAPPESPQPFTLWYRSTLGLRRIDGSWCIVHEHTSTPFHMDIQPDGSFRAATDLEP